VFLLTLVLVVGGIVHAVSRPASWWRSGWERAAWVIAQLAVLPLAFSYVLFPLAIAVTAAYFIFAIARSRRARVRIEDVHPGL